MDLKTELLSTVWKGTKRVQQMRLRRSSQWGRGKTEGVEFQKREKTGRSLSITVSLAFERLRKIFEDWQVTIGFGIVEISGDAVRCGFLGLVGMKAWLSWFKSECEDILRGAGLTEELGAARHHGGRRGGLQVWWWHMDWFSSYSFSSFNEKTRVLS